MAPPDLPPSVYIPAFLALCSVIVWMAAILKGVLVREQARADAAAALMAKFVVVPGDHHGGQP